MIESIFILVYTVILVTILIWLTREDEVDDGGMFTLNPDDYYVKEISLPGDAKKYVPMAKLTTGKWVHIKEGPWAIGEYYDNYKDAKYVCDDCCNQIYLNS